MSAMVIQKIIQFIHLVLHRGLGSFTSNPYIFKINNIVPRCSGTFIKNKAIRTVGIFASFALTLLTVAAVFPITHKTDTAEATYVPATTTLSIVSSKDTASVDITPTSASGSFATSAAADMAEFTVTTDNLTGYSLNILGTDTSGQLVNSTTGDTLDTITSDTTENDFRTGLASTYNNKWGYRLTVNSTTTTDFFSAPTSTSTAKTIYTTSAPNTTGTSDSFTLGVGARVDYTKPVGTYTNTFVLTAVANNISYQINYLDADGTTQLLTPDAESDISASSIELNSTAPTKSGYNFLGWCDGALSADGESCTGTTYQPGDIYTFASLPSTGTVTANLYAMWEESTPIMQNLSLSQCTTTPMTVKDSRDGEKYTVAKLADGNCWLLENLRLDISDPSVQAKLTSTTTNASDETLNYLINGGGSSPYPANGVIAKTASGGSWANDYTNPYIATQYRDTIQPASGSSPAGKIGIYYNYCAASAGSYCYATNASSGNVSQDICPSGWRMPTGGASGEYQALYTVYSSNVANFQSALSTPLSGGFNSSTAYDQGTSGYFWSSTRSSNGYMYNLGVGSSSVSPQRTYVRVYGTSVRCVLQPTMQNFTTQEAESMATGETKTLADSRDNQTYTVAKLADGNVWMTRNLAIGCNGAGSTYGSTITSKTLTSSDTNISVATWNTPTNSLSLGDSYDDPRIACSSTYGAWYNYAATTAGTITGSSNTNEAEYSICPKGWRLPTNAENIALVAKIGSSPAVFNPTRGGYYADGTINGSDGRWWSSTSYNTISRYRLYYSGSVLNTSDYIQRNYGTYVRCIKDTSDIPDMQNISAAELNALVPNTGDIATLKDSRDGEKYKVSRLADGNVWLLENLRLDISDPAVQANLTSTTTNATDTVLGYLKNGGGTSPYPASGVSTSWAISYNLPYINTTYKDIVQSASNSAPAGKIGIYYNFCAASAGSYCYVSNASSGDANQDICPAGWRMPTGGTSGEYQTLFAAYSSNVANFQAALSTPLSGYYDTLALYRGSNGYFWSSIRYNNTQMWSLTNSGNDLAPQDYTNGVRNYGFSVRCLAK